MIRLLLQLASLQYCGSCELLVGAGNALIAQKVERGGPTTNKDALGVGAKDSSDFVSVSDVRAGQYRKMIQNEYIDPPDVFSDPRSWRPRLPYRRSQNCF
jgi:hypothetical protein